MQIRASHARLTTASARAEKSTPKRTAEPQRFVPPEDRISLSGSAVPSPTASAVVATATEGLATVAAASAAASSGAVVAQAVFAGLQTGFIKDYIDPQATLAQCKELAARYPDLVELVELPQRSHGYDGKRADLHGSSPLYYLRLGPRTADREQKLGVYQHASPHAREHVNPMTMLELAHQLCANYDPNSTDPAVMANTALLDKLDIFIAPQPNPDGANYSFYDDKSWRKNRAPHDGTDTGVDINRNYPYRWTGSKRPDYQTYPGKSPASEPETQALIGVVDRHPNIRFVLDWHSAAEELRRPQGVSNEDQAIYDEFHARMRDAIASSRGRQYSTVVSNVVEGSSDDYWYHERGIFSTVVEAARSFQPAKAEALEVMTECARGAREALEFAADYADRHGLARTSPPPASA